MARDVLVGSYGCPMIRELRRSSRPSLFIRFLQEDNILFSTKLDVDAMLNEWRGAPDPKSGYPCWVVRSDSTTSQASTGRSEINFETLGLDLAVSDSKRGSDQATAVGRD